MDTGDTWGYRARQVDPLTPVEVLRIGDKRPARVLVRFLDESMEDRQEWVPPARLKVLWAERTKFIENESRWVALHALAVEDGSAADFAADFVFRALVPKKVAEYEMSGHARVFDAASLARHADVDLDTVIAHTAAFELDDGTWMIPWPVTESIVRRLAIRNSNRLLQAVEAEERDFEAKATHGYHYRSSFTGKMEFMEPEEVASSEMENYQRPQWNLLREWCGEETVDVRDELNALRVEIRRVGGIAEQAIGILRLHGLARQAEALSNDLGLPVEKGAGR